MSHTDTKNIRIDGDTCSLLKRMKPVPEVKEIAVDRGIIDDVDDRLTWEDMFALIVPEEDIDPFERPEEDMAWRNAGEAREDISDLAGENVAHHEVVSNLTEQFIEQHDLDLEVQS